MRNHEGQPRPPSQPTNAGDTEGQKRTHPKVREGQQGDLTRKPSRYHRNWSTLTQGANPHYSSKQAEQEKPIKRREGLSPTHVTREAEGQTPRDQKTLREPAAGKTTHAAGPEEEHGTREKTKWRSKEPSNPTPRVDQQTGARQADAPVKGAEPRRGSSGRGSCAGTREKPKGEQDICTKTPPTPR